MKLIFITMCLFLSNFVYALVNPKIEWQSIHTERFEIIYDKKQQDLALIYAQHLENHVLNLKNHFRDIPEKTIVILNDSTDAPNGYATYLPYPTIMLFPVQPPSMMTISQYGEWSYELSLHEYTHILSFHPVRGVFKGLRSVFGNILAPNMLLPRWWLEGLAVYEETQFSDFGRLRSPYQDAVLRSFTTSNTWDKHRIDQINESSIPSWPYGHRPYIFGSLMWNQIIAMKGEAVIDELIQRHGGRIPFLIETPALEHIGANYTNIFEQSKTHLIEKTKGQITQINSVPESKIERLNLGFKNGEVIKVSPDQLKLAYVSTDDLDTRKITILERKDVAQDFDFKLKPKLAESSVNYIDWSPLSDQIIFDKIDQDSVYTQFSDLHLYNLKNKKTEQITFSERATEPSFSPDGQKVVYVRVEAGRTFLKTIDIKSKQKNILYSSVLQERISNPIYLNENQIAFSLRNQKGEQKLVSIDLQTQLISELLTQYPDIDFLSKVDQGYVFSSSKNGVFNLYFSNSEFSQINALTNSNTAIFTATQVTSGTEPAKNKKYYVTFLDQNGHQVGVLQNPFESEKYELENVKPLTEISKKTLQTQTAFNHQIADYKAFPHLTPTYWMPTIYQTDRGTQTQIETSGQDPLSFHSYLINFGYETGVNEANYFLNYTNTQTSKIISLTTSQTYEILLDTDVEIKNNQWLIQGAQILPYDLPNMQLALGLLSYKKSTATQEKLRMGPRLDFVYQNFSQKLIQITPESGWAVKSAFTNFNNDLSDTKFNQAYVSGEYFFSKWLPKRHAILIRGTSLYSDKLLSLAYSSATTNYNFSPHSLSEQFLVRGYLSGQFAGSKMNVLNLEYRLPISQFYKGLSTWPVFSKQAHISLIADALDMEGFAYQPTEDLYYYIKNDKIFANYGIEAKLDTTLGYQIPLTFFVGIYYPVDKEFGPTPQMVIGASL